MVNNKKIKNVIEEPRINDEINGYEQVRLIYKSENGENKSMVITLEEAKRKAERDDKDLIEVNCKSTPPIVKIEDYSKYLYELKKQMKSKNKPTNTIKEVQLRTNISDHDLEIKANKARKFITDGDKVKVVLTMRGRELSRRDESKRSIYQFVNILSDISVPESVMRDEGNRCVVTLKKK